MVKKCFQGSVLVGIQKTIQYASDLHTEFGSKPLRRNNVKGDILVLAGDNAGTPSGLATFLNSLSSPVPVVVILGNHEFYGHDFDKISDSYRYAIDRLKIPNIHFLDNETRIIGGTRFVASVLWTDFLNGKQGNSCEMGMNDFFKIHKGDGTVKWQDILARHRDCQNFLEQELETPFNGPTVVVTHHAPSALSNPPQFAGSRISGGFYSNMDDFIFRTQPDLWIHGHIHSSMDYVVGKTRVLCNPYGYKELETNPHWDPEALVAIENHSAISKEPEKGVSPRMEKEEKFPNGMKKVQNDSIER